MNIKLLLATIITALAFCKAAAQDKANFKFRNLQVSEGLSENTVNAIHQDQDGFIWVGTKDGLNRFDGSSFKVFKYQKGKNGTLGNNFIRSIAEKDSDNLYIGTDDGLYIMNKTSESFIRVQSISNGTTPLKGAINALLVDKSKKLWIGTMTQGIYTYDPSYSRLLRVKINISTSACWVLIQDRAGTVWAGTARGLLCYSRQNQCFDIEPSVFSLTDSNVHEVLSIYEDKQGNLWLGTWSSGLRCYNKYTHTYSSFLNVRSKYSTYVSHIRAICEYDNNRLLIGSDDGLYLFSLSTRLAQRVDVPGYKYSLSDQSIYSLKKDREGGIWIGTYFGGLNYLNNFHLAIETYHSGPKNGLLSGKAVSQFCEDPSGNLWIATEDGGLNYFDTKTKAITQPIKTTYDNIHALLLDGDDLWIGTFSRGIDVYNINTGKLKNFRFNPKNPNTINHDCVFSIYKTKAGDILIGTVAGLNRYDKKSKNFMRIDEVKGFIYDIKEDYDRNLWIACYGGGAIKLDNESGQWLHYDILKQQMKDPIVRSKLTSIFIDSQKRPILSSEGRGIFIYNKITDSFINISEADGLPNGVVYGVLEDNEGFLWLSSNKGLICFNPEVPRSLKVYDIDNGLQSNQFNYKSSFISKSGRFYFGGVNGFSSFYPSDLKGVKNPVLPKVRIIDIQLIGNIGATAQKYLWTSPNNKQQIKLNHDRSSFSISFASLSYTSPGKNQYAYKLEGIDKEWNYAGNNKNVTYINLPPGNYNFVVKGSNNDGVWNETPTSVIISVLPPFWWSIYARIAYVIFSIVTIFILIRHHLRRSKIRQAKQLELFKSEQETKTFHSKIEFFTSIAHEIRTPLSLISAPLEEILSGEQKREEERYNLSIIEKNCERLKILINELLDFRNIDKAGFKVCSEKFDLKNLLTEIFRTFQKVAKKQEIEMSLKLPAGFDLTLVSDQEALTKIINNLLSNALKFAHSRITLELIDRGEQCYTIIVQDDGPGIPNGLKELIFEPFFQIKSKRKLEGSGIGLALVKHLISLLDGTIEVISTTEGGTAFHVIVKSNQPSTCVAQNASKGTTEYFDHHSVGNNNSEAILIVEDNDDMASFIRSSLIQTYFVDTAAKASVAIEMLKEKSYNLIISDIMMPDMDGINFVNTIKTDPNYSHLPVILLSAKIDNTSKADGLQAGADVYIEKPFSVSHLKSQIRSLIQNRKAVLELFNRSPLYSYSFTITNKRDESFLLILNQEIEIHLSDEHFNVELLAGKLKMSRSNLQRKLKQITNNSPGDYLRNYRLRKAALLLLKPDARINEVAFNTGFSSASYFTKAFIKYYSLSPKEFIKQHTIE